ncbi:MAG: LptF/LptG family permease [Rhodospirillaceae bacterium]|nr:LptF/LptG family permease [Rhodospirillaceae bacterium]
MTGITRYVARQLLIGTALVSVVLVFIVWLTQSLRFLQFVMNKGLPVMTWLKLTVFMLPGFFTLILPFAFLVVVLFVYNKLSMDKELVVVQAAGMSRLGLALPAIGTAGALTVCALIMSSFVVPAAVRAFKEMQWTIQTDVSQILLREGAFNNLGSGLTVYVRKRAPNGELIDLMVNDERLPSQPITLLAARGMVNDGENGPRVMLYSGSRQERQDAGELSVLYFDSYALDIAQAGRPQGSRTADNRERGTADLLGQTQDANTDAAAIARMRAEAHQRLTSPLTILGYAMLAVVWLLSGTHDRRGQAGRISLAILTVVALQAAGLSAMNAVAKSAVLAPLMYMVAILPVVICGYLLSRGAGAGVGQRPVSVRS